MPNIFPRHRFDSFHTGRGAFGPGGVSADLALWLNNEDWAVTGAGISQWNDSAGTNSPTQGVDADRPPVLGAAINGLPAADPDGGTDYLAFGSTPSPAGGEFVLFYVCEVAAGAQIMTGTNAANSHLLSATLSRVYSTGGQVNHTMAGGAGWHIYHFYRVGNNWSAFVDNVASVSNPIVQAGDYPSFVNLFRGGAAFGGNKMGEMILYNEKKSNTDITRVYNSLSAKYNIP